MTRMKCLRVGFVAIIVAAALAAPARATTLVRVDLEELVARNSTIVVGRVVEADSYWNQDGSFILTDIRVATTVTLKGEVEHSEITITLMGGTVGDTTTLIIGGAELFEGSTYLLFLNEEDLPGKRALTVRDHVQGVFRVLEEDGGPRAISEAVSHPLVPDSFGEAEPPGGAAGMPLAELLESIRVIDRSSRSLQE